MAIIKYAAAKINLLLDITSRLENGYHSIYSIMQSVGLYDKISISKGGGGEIQLSCSNPLVPLDEGNTAYRAARLFFEYANMRNKGLNIDIEKHIPLGSGLAGGSADAAAVLIGLNELYETEFSDKDLAAIGVKVGADVPFCLQGGTMLVQNIGDVLSDLPPLPACHILLVKPPSSVSTIGAYEAFDKKENIRHPNKEYALEAAVAGDLRGICRHSSNVFEQVVEVVERVEIKSIMRKYEALYTFMTGSGSTICAVFEEGEGLRAEGCHRELSGLFPQSFLTVPVNEGVLDFLEK